MILQIQEVDLCVICIILNLGLSVLCVTVQITELIIPLPVKPIRQSGENTPNIALVKLNQESVEYYKGLEKVNHGIHRLEDQILNVMMMIMRIHLLLLIILVQPDTTVWKLYVHNVVLS